MAALDLAIRGATLVEQGRVDVGILGERIAQIGGEFEAIATIDGTGKLLLPGGVDAHVHLSRGPGERPGPAWVDDFTSGSAAALAGGITTLGNMTLGPLEQDLELASAQAIADVFLHPVVSDPEAADVAGLAAQGCVSIKIFLSNPRFDLHAQEYLEVIRTAGQYGLITMLHCEDAAFISYATRRLVEGGQTSLRYFAASRPVVAELVATQRAVAIAELTGSPVYIVHLSSARALEVCVEARSRGLPVYVETRPLYLHLTEAAFDGPEPGLFVGQPPLRAQSDVDALWHGLANGSIDTVCTDHAPWSRAAKLDPDLTVERVRPGVENLQLLMPMLYFEGVHGGRISLRRFVEVTSTTAARLFGLYPRKGAVAVGSDADLVLFDPLLERTVSASMLKSNADYSVYAGRKVTGWPVLSIRRGEVVFRDDVVLGRAGSGQVLRAGYNARHWSPI